MTNKIENIKKTLPGETPFVNMVKINELLENNEITHEEAIELHNWNMGMEIDWIY